MTMAFALPQVEIMWNGQTPNAIEFQDFEPLDGGEDLLLQPLSPGSFASLQLSPVSLFEQVSALGWFCRRSWCLKLCVVCVVLVVFLMARFWLVGWAISKSAGGLSPRPPAPGLASPGQLALTLDF
eukprot:m.89649 g.89649  ORF g.89649 m.89649 type:complete len:126 (+) comp51053_c0_seq4:634-1011(+)